MVKKIGILFILMVSLAWATDIQLTGLDEIKPGVKGVGYTVVEGDKIEPFDIEVLKNVKGEGVIKEMILAKVVSDNIKRAGGISEGMSGSPIYINEKLAGAISYFAEGTDNIVLITPISDMVKLAKFDDLDLSGLPDTKFIKPGMAIIATPIRGDISIDNIGTLTYVKGNEFFAMGHPIDKKGNAKYFLNKAYIDYSINSKSMPFKMGRSGETIGVVTQDRKAGIFGYFSKEVKSSKFNVETKTKYEVKNTNFEIVSDERTFNMYLSAALELAVKKNIDSDGYRTAKYNIEIFDDNNNMLFKKADVVYFDETLIENTADLIASEIVNILDNPFKEIRIKKANIKIELSENKEIAYIKDFSINRNVFRIGEYIELSINYQVLKKGTFKEKVKIPIPQNMKIGEYVIKIYSGSDRKKDEPEFYDIENYLMFYKTQNQNNEVLVKILKSDGDTSPDTTLEQKILLNYYMVSKRELEGHIIIDSFEAKQD